MGLLDSYTFMRSPPDILANTFFARAPSALFRSSARRRAGESACTGTVPSSRAAISAGW